MKTLTVNNVVGYPTYTTRIIKFAERKKAILYVGVQELLNLTATEKADTNVWRIIVDNVPNLTSCGIPIIGYSEVSGTYHKHDLNLPKKNTLKVIIPTNLKRLPKAEFAEVLKAKVKLDALNKFDPKTDSYVRVKAMFSHHLPASLYDKDPVKKIKDENVSNS